MNAASAPKQGSILYAAELFQQSKHTVLLTGAGFSTPSGIPDFRSEGTGLWAKLDPMEVASLDTFRKAPEKFYAWIRPLIATMQQAQPNAAHLAVARMGAAGFVREIITQNIDGLHQKAGSRNVLEMHGTLRTLSCGGCFRQFPNDNFIEPFINDGIIPRCPECGGLLKPDAILFGEQLPVKSWQAARQAARTCDLMLVAGSSLEVLPVAGLPLQALDRGAHLIIVNQSPTYLSVRADAVLLGDVAEILPLIAKRVLDE
ncbi:MAG: NAD-dependent deacetylase [Anaerolineaceae bacterium]|nr:MAG: NAD-dependent deacetylase [Anaerolineaceae bacterium]